MNWESIFVGLAAFVIIGVFHPIVIKGEYYFSKRIWPLFLIAGILFVAGALFTEGNFLSAVLSITGFTCLWSIKELFEQEKRVEKGWFPKRGEKKNDAADSFDYKNQRKNSASLFVLSNLRSNILKIIFAFTEWNPLAFCGHAFTQAIQDMHLSGSVLRGFAAFMALAGQI